MFTKPSFSEDVSRHGMSAAMKKRFSSVAVANQSYKYQNIETLNGEQLTWLFGAAAAEANSTCVAWVFETLLIRCGGQPHLVWQPCLAALYRLPETCWGASVSVMLKYVRDPNELSGMNLGAFGNLIIGKYYATEAQLARGVSKSTLQSSKARALHFLGQARQQVATMGGPDPYRQTAAVATMAAAIAAAYEGTAYLQYKGTRTTALVE